MSSQCDAYVAKRAGGNLIGDMSSKMSVDWRLLFPSVFFSLHSPSTPGILCTTLAAAFKGEENSKGAGRGGQGGVNVTEITYYGVDLQGGQLLMCLKQRKNGCCLSEKASKRF